MFETSLRGRLLVATPTLKDPNFDRTVVLLVAHEAGGALGVVLNRATEVPVSDVLGSWGELAGDPAVLFEGGPVQPESAICLARTRPDVKKRITGFHQVSGALGTVDLSADPDRPKKAEQDGLGVAGSRFTYAIGRLALSSKTPGLVDDKGAVLASVAIATSVVV